jgi:membrane-associated PAP2 superfamily phosphatase
MMTSQARKHLFVLIALMLLSTLPFWLFPLDIQISRLFYHPELGTGDAAWPLQNLPFVQLCYKAAPILTMLVALPALFIVLFGGLLARLKPWRAHAAVVVLTVVLGPGLLVNGIFKEFWDRPRPVQTQDFGGEYPYAPPLMIGEAAGGKSFPCGHCSAGFALAALWLLWRKRRPRLAAAALTLALVLGASMGFSRIAAGGHYLSDVLWAAWLSFFAAWLSYYIIMRIPQREANELVAQDADTSRLPKPLLWGVGSVVTVAVVIGALMASPVDLRWQGVFEAPIHDAPWRVRIERASPEIWLYPADVLNTGARLLIDATWQGFGLPGGKIKHTQNEQGWVLRPRGVFSELRDQVKMQAYLNAGQSLQLELDTKARVSVHCAEGISHDSLKLSVPPEQVRWNGCGR